MSSIRLPVVAVAAPWVSLLISQSTVAEPQSYLSPQPGPGIASLVLVPVSVPSAPRLRYSLVVRLDPPVPVPVFLLVVFLPTADTGRTTVGGVGALLPPL